MDEQKAVKKLKSEGYGNVWIYEAGSSEIDEEHSHDYETRLVILSGAINITSVIGDAVTNMQYKAGSEVVIPRNKLHSAKASAEGCRYIIAERHHSTRKTT
jgi:hypothetical protein